MATRAPLAASDWATARPMPLLPPVIKATAFRRFILPPHEIEPSPDCTPRGLGEMVELQGNPEGPAMGTVPAESFGFAQCRLVQRGSTCAGRARTARCAYGACWILPPLAESIN